jgi:hypothetical protein
VDEIPRLGDDVRRRDVKQLVRWSACVCALVTLSMGVSSCVTTTVQEIRQASTGIGSNEAVVVLGRHNNSADESEDDFINCVSNNLSGGNNKVGVISEAAFVDAMFPWFEPRTAPLNTSDLPEIVNQPILADKLDSIGVRYVIWIEGNTHRTAQGGAMTCSVSVAGAGCFGFLSWENDSSYEASIWDIRHGTSVGKVSSDANGTSFMPAVIVPIPFIARVQSGACSSMASQLKTFITKES